MSREITPIASLSGDKLAVIPEEYQLGKCSILTYTLGCSAPVSEYKVPLDKNCWHYNIIELTSNMVSFNEYDGAGLKKYSFDGKLLETAPYQWGHAVLPTSHSSLAEYWCLQRRGDEVVITPSDQKGKSGGIPCSRGHSYRYRINATTVYLVDNTHLELYDRKDYRLRKKIPFTRKITNMLLADKCLYLDGENRVDVFSLDGTLFARLKVDGDLVTADGEYFLTYAKSTGLSKCSLPG